MNELQPPLGKVVRALRGIRDVTLDEVAEAMRDHLAEIAKTLPVNLEKMAKARPGEAEEVSEAKEVLSFLKPLTAQELDALEESGRSDVSIEQLFLLGETLGLAFGNIPWFVSLIFPDAPVRDPHWSDANAGRNAWYALLRDIDRWDAAANKKLPFTTTQLKALYRKTQIVTEPEMRETLLRRFLRTPFPQARFEIGVIGSQDGSMFPYFMPGTLMLLDRRCRIAVGPEVDHACNTYWCIHQDEHRCYWPVERDGRVLLSAPASPGVYIACDDVTLVGAPRTALWQIAEERSKDFFNGDFRDRDTQNYVHALRAGGLQ